LAPQHELTPAGAASAQISKEVPAKIPADREFEDQARSCRRASLAGPPISHRCGASAAMEYRPAIGYKHHRDRGENSQECVGGFSMSVILYSTK
jgi:hypothetical protein